MFLKFNTQIKPLYAGKSCTFEEYLALPDDGVQYERFKGVLQMVPAPLYSHQSIVTHLAFRISVFLEQNPLGIVCVAPRDVKLAADVNVQPDILFIAKERLGINRPQYVDGAPDLIVEVLSRGTMGRDMREKFAYYEQYGVKEYWILSPEDVFASEFYHLESGRYQPFYPAQSKLYSHVLAGFVLDLNQLEKALHPFD